MKKLGVVGMYFPYPPPCPPGCIQYVVKPGDTLHDIAAVHGIRVERLTQANPGIAGDNLFIGHFLCIPPVEAPPVCPVGYILHTVKKADSLVSISRQFSTNTRALLAANPGIKPGSLTVGSHICVPKVWNTYRNFTYKILLRHPSTWRKITEDRVQGPDGYFQVSALTSTGTLYDVCFNESYHILKPYGSRPVVVRAQIQGQSACFILPSADQPPEMNKQAGLLVVYSEPVVISGQPYNYLALWAHKDYIQTLADTLQFIR
jgi:LysM repeat protein